MVNDAPLATELGEMMNAADARWNENYQPDLQQAIALIFNVTAQALGDTRRLEPQPLNELSGSVEQEAKDSLFEALRGASVTAILKTLDGQISSLEILSERLQQICTLKGSAGFRAFDKAKKLAESIDYAMANLNRIKIIAGVQ